MVMVEVFQNFVDHLPRINRKTVLVIAAIVVLVGGGIWLANQTDSEAAKIAAATATLPPATQLPPPTENPLAQGGLNPTLQTGNKTVCVGPYAGPGTTLWSAWNENGQPETVTVVYPNDTRELIINLGNDQEPYGVLPRNYPPGTCLEIPNP